MLCKVSSGLTRLRGAGIAFCDTNKAIRAILSKPSYILKEFKNETIRVIQRKYISLPLSPKVKKVNIRIINAIFIRLKFNLNTCVFCENDTESLHHVFFHCERVQAFWNGTWSCTQSRATPSSGLIIKSAFCYEGYIFLHKCRCCEA